MKGTGTGKEIAARGPLAVVDRFVVTRAEAGAVRYLAEQLAVAHGRRERLRHSLARTLGVAGSRRWLLESVSPGDLPQRFHEPLRRLDLCLGPAGEALFAGPPFDGRPPAGFVLLVDYATHPRGQAVVFLFAAGGHEPRAVLKLRPGGDSGVTGAVAEGGATTPLAREATVLDRLQVLPGELAATVPRRRGFQRLPDPVTGGEVQALLTSCLPGRSAYVELSRGVIPGSGRAWHLELAARWLGRFHRATRGSGVWSPPSPDDPVLDPARDPAGHPPDWFHRLVTAAERVPLTLSAGHGDFWARNLLVPPKDSGRELPGVVDWEGYRPEAPPFEDLFHFPWTYASVGPWGRRGVRPASARGSHRAFQDAFLGRGDGRGARSRDLFRPLRRYFEIYVAETGLPWDRLDPLFRLFLLMRRGAAGEVGTDGTDEEAPWLHAYRAFDRAPRSVFSG